MRLQNKRIVVHAEEVSEWAESGELNQLALQDEKPSANVILDAQVQLGHGLEDVYQRQGGGDSATTHNTRSVSAAADTIISWNDQHLQADLALRYH